MNYCDICEFYDECEYAYDDKITEDCIKYIPCDKEKGGAEE